MSNRTILELNHDYCPSDEQLLEWAKAIQVYLRSGDKDLLPRGIAFIDMRHHSEPSPIDRLTRENRELREQVSEWRNRGQCFPGEAMWPEPDTNDPADEPHA